MGIDIVVVNYKRYDLLNRFLDSFHIFAPSSDYTLMVVDNEATDDVAARVGSHTVLRSQDNLSYGRGCNWGASMGSSRYIGLFNNDVRFVNNTSIDMMIEYMDSNPDVGICGPRQISTDGKLTHAGIVGPPSTQVQRGWLSRDTQAYKFNDQVPMVSGSAMIVRREYWDKVFNDFVYRELFPDALGAMLETPLYFEDAALCFAAPKFGYKVMYMGSPGYEMIHDWHQTIKDYSVQSKYLESKQMFKKLLTEWGIYE